MPPSFKKKKKDEHIARVCNYAEISNSKNICVLYAAKPP